MTDLMGEAAHLRAARGDQKDLFAASVEVPVLLAYGFGVNSTALAVEMVKRGERITHALSSNTGAEQQKSLDYMHHFVDRFLTPNGIPHTEVSYKPTRFKNFPKYNGLIENCLTNATLPSISFGYKSCSSKFKIAPQNRWTEGYEPARRIWSEGGRVVKLIGYDAGGRDRQRAAVSEGSRDGEKYLLRYPLQEWGMDRTACEASIRSAGLDVPPKSSCFMCLSMKPDEVAALEPGLLRIIVLLEARVAGRLTTIEGLWRRSTTGVRSGVARPGSMTAFIRQRKLLDEAEIEAITAHAPRSLVAFLDDCAEKPFEERPELKEWMEFFDQIGPLGLDRDGAPKLYGDHHGMPGATGAGA